MPLNFTESLMQPCPLNPITGNKIYSSPQQAMHRGTVQQEELSWEANMATSK